jgi:hypothetical protein
LNLPGRNHVIDLKEDSKVEIVETLLMRNDSYRANGEDMKDWKQAAGSRAASGSSRRFAEGREHYNQARK